MGKLDVRYLRYMSREEFRILTGVEMGMRNHELVPGPLVAQIAKIRSGGLYKILVDLCKKRLCRYERGKFYDGYRLTNSGYDYLALNVLSNREVLEGFGHKIGIGKESDIYIVKGKDNKALCMKLHRLGRVCFRKLREKRDYYLHRHKASWLYLSRLSAAKEFAFMKALYEHGFPIPEPIDHNRHIIIMELIDGDTLCSLLEVEDPAQLYSDLMDLIVKLANYGVIHSDFNEFNVMVDRKGKPVLIDFPQMVSTSHANAKMYFDRDVQCVIDTFKRKFKFESEFFPVFEEDTEREFDLDKIVKASGYARDVREFDDRFIENKEEDTESGDEDSNNEVSSDEDSNNEVSSDEDSDNEASGGERSLNELFENISTVEEKSVCEASASIPMPDMIEKLVGDPTSVSIGDVPDKEVEDNISTCSLSGMSEGPRKNKLRDAEGRRRLIMELAKARQIRREAVSNGEIPPTVEEIIGNNLDDVCSVTSFSSSASRIAPEVVTQRLKNELEKRNHKQIPKKSTRVKGEANSFLRRKKENLRNIEECSGWDDY